MPRAYDPRVPHPPPALAWVGGSLAAVLVVGLLGPSAAVPPLGRNGNAGTVVVTALLAVAVVAGIAAVLLGLRAGRAPPRRTVAGRGSGHGTGCRLAGGQR